MIIDDRLATVLATPLAGAPGTRTQVRQLIDLLDRVPESQWPESHWTSDHDDALDQLAVRLASLPQDDQARIAAEACLRSPRLVAHFADASPRVAAAALGAALLNDAQWLALIPELPPLARGLLRHRRDMGRDRTSAPARLLARLGVGDAALPLPEGYEVVAPAPVLRVVGDAAVAPAPATEPAPASSLPPRVAEEVQGISAIVRRIEAFRRDRAAAAARFATAQSATARSAAGNDDAAPHPHLPFADGFAPPALTAIDITLDPAGEIVGAEGGAAAMLIGHRPFTADARAPAHCDPVTLLAARQRRPVREGRISLEGAPAIASDWRIDAVPCFDAASRTFTGWRARLRRPLPVVNTDLALRPGPGPGPGPGPAPGHAPGPANDDGRDEFVLEAEPRRTVPPRDTDDRLRQLLHELKTPINAIQGFAELIQQQVLGPVAHQYRGYAAAIAADAATMLAQFEAIDQLVRLESGRQPIDPGETDARHALTTLVDRLAPLFDQREAGLSFQPGEEPLPLAIAPEAFEAMVWRLLSTLAAAAVPGEQLTLRLGREGATMRLVARLPQALKARDGTPAPAAIRGEGGLLLGRDFALRLLEAEARAAGGAVRRSELFLTLLLPLLTHSVTNSSQRGVSTAGLGD